VEFRPAVLKNMKRFAKKELRQIKKKIDDLAENLPGPATTKMKGINSFHKIRAGVYRIVYAIHEDRLVILVVKV
jgi:mRNA interferase RelE/StbE